MNFLIISILGCAICLLLTVRCLIWLKLHKTDVNWSKLGAFLLLLAFPLIALALRFEVFNYADLLHHLPRSGYIKLMIILQIIVVGISWFALERSIFNLKNQNQ